MPPLQEEGPGKVQAAEVGWDAHMNILKKEQGEDRLRKPPISARKLTVIIASAWAVWNALYLSLWESFPSAQLILNRISWSSADIVGITATVIALYVYRNWEKSTENEDLRYLSQFVFEMKRAGVDPKKLAPAFEMAAAMAQTVSLDPEFRKRIQRVLGRLADENITRLSKMDEEELYELFRSAKL